MTEIIIITKPNCKPCQAWKNYFRKMGIGFSEIPSGNYTKLRQLFSSEREAYAFVKISGGDIKKHKSLPLIYVNKKLVNSDVNKNITYKDRVKEWRVI